MFQLTIQSPKQIIFQTDAKSAFFSGDTGEFELLDYHAPLLSLLQEGDIVVDGQTYIPIKKGVVKFLNNNCLVLVEM